MITDLDTVSGRQDAEFDAALGVLTLKMIDELLDRRAAIFGHT